ncbi:MAG: branched-chain amino acid ABC transporter permease [Acidothermaceae bacterium]
MTQASLAPPSTGPEQSKTRIRRSTRTSRWALGFLFVAVAILGYLPYGVGQATTTLLVDFFILLTLGITWNLLAGYAGLVSVGQQAYLGLGAYAVLWLAQHGVEPFLALPIAAVFCAVASVPISWLVFRLRGGYFAIGTWAVADVLFLLTLRSHTLGGGTGTNVPGLNGFDPTVLGAYVYWATLGVAIAALLGSYLLLRSRVGLALTAVRDNEVAARSVGVRVTAAKHAVYVAAAIGAGAAGGLLAISQINVQAQNVYGVQWSAYMIFVVLIGGIGTLEGPIIGTIVFFVLQRTLAADGGWYLIIVGSVAVLMAMFARRGVWGIAARFGVTLFPTGYRVAPPTSRTVSSVGQSVRPREGA